MTIDSQLLNELIDMEKKSPRLRMNLDMRNSEMDNSQRMLNAIEPGTELPIHRHRNTSESCFILRGKAEQLFYDDDGNITERIMLIPNSSCVGVNIEPGR